MLAESFMLFISSCSSFSCFFKLSPETNLNRRKKESADPKTRRFSYQLEETLTPTARQHHP